MLVLVLQSVSVWTMLGPTSPLRDVVRTEIWEAAAPAPPPLHLSASLRRKTGGEVSGEQINIAASSPHLTSLLLPVSSLVWLSLGWPGLGTYCGLKSEQQLWSPCRSSSLLSWLEALAGRAATLVTTGGIQTVRDSQREKGKMGNWEFVSQASS